MSLKRHKIDLLSAFQPKQKDFASPSMRDVSELNVDGEDFKTIGRHDDTMLASGPLPGVSVDNGVVPTPEKDKGQQPALYGSPKHVGKGKDKHTESQHSASRIKTDKPDKPDNKKAKHRPSHHYHQKSRKSKIYDDPAVVAGYTSVPLLDSITLPRGGLSIETKAVGRIQFGIPPETIKDSMRLGLDVPEIYVVPVERFCREMGPALGINLAEFEFPAYFNYFVRGRQVTLLVDSDEAEKNIRSVFGETLLGPGQFRNHKYPKPNEDEDFDPTFPDDQRPNFYREFYHFRTAEKSTNYQELSIDTLISFVHFHTNQEEKDNIKAANTSIGVPPVEEGFEWRKSEGDSNAKALWSVGESGRHLTKRKDNNSSTGKGNGVKRLSMSYTDLDALSLSGMEGSYQARTRSQRRGSAGSASSCVSSGSYEATNSWADGSSLHGVETGTPKTSWMFSQVRWLGEVATIYPPDATPEQKKTNKTNRVEIFKMPGGTEYVIHDVDESGVIVGKARFSGTVKVPDEIAVEGFLAPDTIDKPLTNSIDDEPKSNDGSVVEIDLAVPRAVIPPTFHPPSFGVTVLGNSHGFDKNGSTSGYVLWINGRGIMIDPPPYSSSTLEREGIRPQMIVAIIITHCHADHDAGAFQKVLTGSRVAVITTPTIYKSFIRKYAALSGLSATLLRHSHRHRPAIIGQPLKFQGAKFHFTYTLHTIPCIAFKVEWRGKSMVFTGDHLNSPIIETLEEKGVLTKGRADSLRRIPLQDCDVLLHEAGAPPIHTPIAVLQELPAKIKERLYVVHTSALPEDCGLRVAPTGTGGTIRLDHMNSNGVRNSKQMRIDGGPNQNGSGVPLSIGQLYTGVADARSRRSYASGVDTESLDDGGHPSLSVLGDYRPPSMAELSQLTGFGPDDQRLPPLVYLRPTCVSDAWFILNLLSAVPFFSSLSYVNTMEVLEIAHVELFCAGEVVVPAHKRSELLCVVWEGTLVERDREKRPGLSVDASSDDDSMLNSDVEGASTEPLKHGAVLSKGALTVWHAGDWTGPVALQPDFDRSADRNSMERPRDIVAVSQEGVKVITLLMKDLHKVLKRGSKLFRKYQAVKEKQLADEAAVRATMVAKNDIELEGTERLQKLRGDNLLEVLKFNSSLGKLSAFQKRHLESIAEGPRFFEEGSYLWQTGDTVDFAFLIVSGTALFGHKSLDEDHSMTSRRSSFEGVVSRRGSSEFSIDGRKVEEDKLLNVPPNSEYSRLETALQGRVDKMEKDVYDHPRDMLPREELAQQARDRFANKVLARLYSRRAYTSGLIFSRGHFLSDISRMVSGDLAYVHHSDEKKDRGHCHSSTMVAGRKGCVAMIFQRSSLVPFLEGNPGVLLMLLGTHAVV